ncbi:MAG: hypothetical protein V3R46_05885, partial [Thermoplasmata archaeon]
MVRGARRLFYTPRPWPPRVVGDERPPLRGDEAMRIPGRQLWSSLTAQWRGSFRLRLTVGMVATVLLIMSLWSAISVYTQNAAIRESAENRARAFSQAFAMIGAAAVLENLFLIQEAMNAYLEDPDVLEVDVIDSDDMIMAAKNTDRIGLVLTDRS